MMTLEELKFYISKSIDDMIQAEDPSQIFNNNNIDVIIEKLIPYLELRLCNIDLLSVRESHELFEAMKAAAKTSVEDYKEFILLPLQEIIDERIKQLNETKTIIQAGLLCKKFCQF